MEATWIALIGTVLGGPAVLKFIEWIMGRGKTKQDAATAMREELRKESESLKLDAANLREEIRRVEKEMDDWKEKYFTLLQQYLEVKAQLMSKDEDATRW